MRVPQLTAEEKSFGDYAAHYAVITFQLGHGCIGQAAEQPDAKGGMRTLSDIVARRDDLKTVQTALNDMGVALKEQQGKPTPPARSSSPTLKAVYAKAYEKTVTLPADTFRSVLPQINATSTAA